MGNKTAKQKPSAKKETRVEAPTEAAAVDKKPKRKFNVIVWGATGFTGALVCKHIAEQYHKDEIKWAMASRSEEKLHKLRKDLAETHCKSIADVPILTAEVKDPKSLDRLVKQCDVIISTAGPFWSIGIPVVEAAVRNGTHYCDIAGEVHFLRKTVERLHAEAQSKKVKIVHSCGFDSVPSDLGAHMLVEHMRDQFSRKPSRINLLVNDIKGGQSGGSLITMFEQYMLPDEEMQLCEDPFCLDAVPKKETKGGASPVASSVAGAGAQKAGTGVQKQEAGKQKQESGKVGDPAVTTKQAPKLREPTTEETDQFGVRYNKQLNKWTYPFQFSPINSRVVRRTCALLYSEPRLFKYSEAHEAEGPVDAALGAFGHTIVHLVATVPWLRRTVRDMLPKPGDGPPEAFRENSNWKFTLYAWTAEDSKGGRPRQCQAVVKGKRDPGYLETSRMALEAGLCLALQGEELSEKGHLQGGVLTPASAMGSVLRERLQAANIDFEITKTGWEVPTSPLDKLKAAPKGTGTSVGEKSAAPSGTNKQARHVRMFSCLHTLATNFQRGLHQREKLMPSEKRAGGLQHLHPAVNLVGRSLLHCEAVLTHHRQTLHTSVVSLHNQVSKSREKLQSALTLACAENRVMFMKPAA